LILFDHSKYVDATDTVLNNTAFHCPFDGNDSTHVLLQSEDHKWRTKEAAALSVAVLDERVWSDRDTLVSNPDAISSKYPSSHRTVSRAWERQRVHLLDPTEALTDFKSFVSDVKDQMDDDWKLPIHGMCDFLIVHQGIIDKVKQEQGKDLFKNSWQSLKKRYRWIVIDTGRGSPDQAEEEGLRWVEYSNLADPLLHAAADKFQLSRLLFALRADTVGTP